MCTLFVSECLFFFYIFYRAYEGEHGREHNITVVASFGLSRELAFQRTAVERGLPHVHLYVPQANNSIVSFSRDIDINWKNGLTFVPGNVNPQSLDTVSVMVRGFTRTVIGEFGSPPMLNVKAPNSN